MFSERGIKALAASLSPRELPLPMGASARLFRRATSAASSLPASSLPASIQASRVVVPLLLAEAAAFALGVASGKIPVFLFTAIRALLTF